MELNTFLSLNKDSSLKDLFLLAQNGHRNYGFCCDHIATEDGNLDKANLQFCLDLAKERFHADCYLLISILISMDEETRYEVTGFKK